MLTRFIHPLIVLLLATAASGAPNAADDYRELMRQWENFPDEQQMLLENLPAHFEPSPESIAALGTLDSIDATIARAARKDRCDFGLDYSRGPELLLPHLATMRGTARHMEVMVRWHRSQGNDAAAIRTLDAMYGLGFHLADDRLLISSLVGQSIFTTAEGMTTELLEMNAVSPEAATLLLRRLKKIQSNDPFRLAEAVEMESNLMRDWAQLQLQTTVQPDGTYVMSDESREFFEMIRSNADEEVDWVEMFQANELQQYSQFMDNVTATFKLEDETAATARVQELEVKLVEGEYGDFAKLLAVAPQGALKQKFVAERELADLISTLQAIADGTADPLAHANAAWWYIRAARAMSMLSAEQRASGEFWPPIRDDLMIATVIERCEFPGTEDAYYPVPVVSAWSAEMRQCLYTLLQDARRLQEQGDTNGTVRMLAMTLEIAADLASNTTLVDSITAQDVTEQVIGIAEPMQAAGQLDVENRRRLLQAVRAIPTRDPFGYMNAADATRRLIIGHIGEAISPEVTRAFPTDPDGVLFAAAWCENIHETAEPYGFTWPLEVDWSSFDGVLSPDAVLNARSRGSEALEAASVGVDVELEPVIVIATPSIAERRRQGATLLRSWKRTLVQ